MSDALGYARVSTAGQSARLQIDALEATGCLKVFSDQASGKLDRRPELDRLLDQIRPGDTLVVWRLDRLGRSVRHLLDLVAGLDERKVGFRSLTENIDTTTSGGRLVFHIFAALAQMERELISERTRAGLDGARALGRTGGRRPVMTPEKTLMAREMLDSRKHTVAAVAKNLGVSRSALYRALAFSAVTDVTVKR